MNQLARMRKGQCVLPASKLKYLKVLLVDIPLINISLILTVFKNFIFFMLSQFKETDSLTGKFCSISSQKTLKCISLTLVLYKCGENITIAFKFSLLLEKFGTELQLCENWMGCADHTLTITGQLELKHTEQVLSQCNCGSKLHVHIVDHGGRASEVQRIVQCPNLNVSCDLSSAPAQDSPFQNHKDSLY